MVSFEHNIYPVYIGDIDDVINKCICKYCDNGKVFYDPKYDCCLYCKLNNQVFIGKECCKDYIKGKYHIFWGL